jgi:hypothetical protein
MRRRNLLRSRVYRYNDKGKRIASTFNQSEKMKQTYISNSNMSLESNKYIKTTNSITKINLYFSLDISCCEITEVMDDIPNNTPIDSYGNISDLFIKNVYFKNKAGNRKETICNLDIVTALTYTKWVQLYFVIFSNDNKPIPQVGDTFNVNGQTLTYSETNFKINKKDPRSAKFRLPIKGYRKEIKACENENFSYGKNIYKDNYAKATNGSGCKYDCSGNVIGTVTSRTNYPVIRSGMLDKNDGKSFRSYRDYLRNGAMISYDRSLEKNRKDKDDCNCYYKNSDGSQAGRRCSKNINTKTIYKPSNKKFQVQGAVSSSSRLDRLKLDTITGANAKCKNRGTDKRKDIHGCDPYFAGNPRFTGWIYNSKNPETVNYDKRQRPLGKPQHQKYRTNKNTVHCSNKNHKSRVEGGCCDK